MIIVGQDINVILNFKKTSYIYIEKNELMKKIMVKANTDGEKITLGIYSDDEQVTKVIEDILNKYLEYATIGKGENAKFIAELPRMFIMPKDKVKEQKNGTKD